MRFVLSIYLAALWTFLGSVSYAQTGSPIAVQQVPSTRVQARVSGTVRVTPVPGTNASASASRTAAPPTVPQQVIDACRDAQAEDRPPPAGIDCIGAMQAVAAASATSTAEASLLGLSGLRADVTGTPAAQTMDGTNADAAARQLATGEVQSGTGSGAAAIVASQRAAPPPSPRP